MTAVYVFFTYCTYPVPANMQRRIQTFYDLESGKLKNYPLSFYLYLITKNIRQLIRIQTDPMSGPAFALQAGLGGPWTGGC